MVIRIAELGGLFEHSYKRVKNFFGVGNDLLGRQDETIISFVSQFVGEGNWYLQVGLDPVHRGSSGDI